MPEFYLDLETYSPTKPIDFYKDPIITIAYQQINAKTGEVLTPLTILKSWESSEAEILEQFYQTFNIGNRWAFVPVGYKLADFDFVMLGTHWRKIGKAIDAKEIYNHPFMDLYTTALLCNGGEFKGCSLHNIAGKQGNGGEIAELYQNKAYDKIEAYIKDEAQAFNKFFAFLVNDMPNTLKRYQNGNNG